MGTTTKRSIAARPMGPTQILFLFMLPFFAFAQDPNNGNNDGSSLTDLMSEGRLISLTWERMVAGFILLSIGLFLTFRGYRFYRFTLFLTGFITGCVIVFSILLNVEPQQGWENRQIIYVFSCIAGGLLVGAICFVLNRFTVWIVGGLAGLATALYMLAWRSGGLIHSSGGRIGLLVGASVVGLLLGLLLGHRILIPATAIIGAYVSILGLDLFARTGFAESVKQFFKDNGNDSVFYYLNTNLYIMLGAVGGLIVLGLLFQTLLWRRRQQRLVALGRSLHNDAKVWSLWGMRTRTVRPDPTYPNGSYAAPDGYNGEYNNGYDNGNNTTAAYIAGNNTTAAYNTGNNEDVVPVNEKKSWNPFKKSKTPAATQNNTTTTTTTTDDPNQERPVSYSSNTALHQ
ncbi:hypothetical protein BGZ96_003806 [Linnemannia gamsii]|uniref:Transmembrane protein 198 n=1 Tax=Linnemannia gamsii TaxID=64522 RepID=A0ABQ7K886_9FUNG|nr:hypothetical protein BGZ96_003806 [Linnemannia gamsii]